MSRFPLVPQSLFGRLFTAVVGVVILTLLIIALLIARERRQFAFLTTGAGNSTRVIAETSESLAKLPPAERAAMIEKLREQPLVIEDVRRRRPPPKPAELRDLEESFVAQLRRELGPGYGVVVRRASPDHTKIIRIEWARGGQRPGAGAGEPEDALPELPALSDAEGRRVQTLRLRGAPARHLTGRYDVTITLPDGERVLFRALPPFPPFPMPRAIFMQLGVLTVLLGIALFVMTRTITRPLRELATAADAVGRGAYLAPLAENGAREIRRATRAFNTMQERLRRYLESRTRVLAAMSHDLRTTLTRLRLRAESIENEDLRARFSADLDEMARMVQGALGLFRDLNADEPLERVDIDQLLDTLRQEFAEMDAEIVIEGRTQGPLTARPLALKRCLTNLLHNAIKFGEHATVIVEDGEELVIRIRDRGPGIPPEALEQVFEPFFRVEGSRNRDTGGAGLGLCIARDTAQAHGGSLTLQNLPERGLEAILKLPRAESPDPGRS